MFNLTKHTQMLDACLRWGIHFKIYKIKNVITFDYFESNRKRFAHNRNIVATAVADSGERCDYTGLGYATSLSNMGNCLRGQKEMHKHKEIQSDARD